MAFIDAIEGGPRNVVRSGATNFDTTDEETMHRTPGNPTARSFDLPMPASASAPWAPLFLRAIVGFGFVMHGYAKLARGPETFAVVLHTLGVPFSGPLAWLTAIVELIGGLAVLAGAFLPLVSIPLAVVLVTALFTVHRPYGFFSVKLAAVTSTGTTFGPVGYEIVLLYLAGLAALALGGAGPLSVDRWRASARARRFGDG